MCVGAEAVQTHGGRLGRPQPKVQDDSQQEARNLKPWWPWLKPELFVDGAVLCNMLILQRTSTW